MSKPNIAFRFISNNQVKFHTSGNGNIREIIYRIFGKDFIHEIIPIQCKGEGIEIEGFLGKPTLNRSNRNFETCFMNGRFVKSNFLYKAIEEGYRAYLMQHKFPFAVLYFTLDTDKVDVNVHPTKMDIRITDSQVYYDFIVNSISTTLQHQEMIPDMEQVEALQKPSKPESLPKSFLPESFEKKRLELVTVKEDFSYITDRILGEDVSITEEVAPKSVSNNYEPKAESVSYNNEPPKETVTSFSQMNLFEEKIIKQENKDKFEILGQVFQTYWIVRFEDKLLFVDQHAAHEKIMYEKLLVSYQTGDISSQTLQPPLVLHLTQKEEAALEEYKSYFENLGFVWEDFGSHSIAMREMPLELYGKNEKRFFEDILDELVENGCKGTPDIIQEKIASMACKAAVKGNQTIHHNEMKELLDQLFQLDNPYHCPHGRPTIISMSKADLEKKFKRIV